jgi:hypothetical protein
VDADICRLPAGQSSGMALDPDGPAPRTLSALASAQAAHLRAGGVDARAQAKSLVLVPVHGGADGWLVVASPLLSRRRQVFALPFAEATLDFALRVDLLLRWILPPVPAGALPRHPAEAAAMRVAFASPLAMLVLRPGIPTAGDSDLAWWQAFGHACAIVGRRPATALTVTPAGVGEIPVEPRVWPAAG